MIRCSTVDGAFTCLHYRFWNFRWVWEETPAVRSTTFHRSSPTPPPFRSCCSGGMGAATTCVCSCWASASAPWGCTDYHLPFSGCHYLHHHLPFPAPASACLLPVWVTVPARWDAMEPLQVTAFTCYHYHSATVGDRACLHCLHH